VLDAAVAARRKRSSSEHIDRRTASGPLGATALMIYGMVETGALVRSVLAAWWPTLVDSSDAPPLLAAIAAVDAFLAAVVLYFIAVGLYQLSFHPLPLPEWLVVGDVDELEDRLAQVVVVVLAIAFLGQAVTWDGQRDLLGFGVATALVIGALAFHVRRKPRAPGSSGGHAR
jgi:uncharacterized membrane protein YqhA